MCHTEHLGFCIYYGVYSTGWCERAGLAALSRDCSHLKTWRLHVACVIGRARHISGRPQIPAATRSPSTGSLRRRRLLCSPAPPCRPRQPRRPRSASDPTTGPRARSRRPPCPRAASSSTSTSSTRRAQLIALLTCVAVSAGLPSRVRPPCSPLAAGSSATRTRTGATSSSTRTASSGCSSREGPQPPADGRAHGGHAGRAHLRRPQVPGQDMRRVHHEGRRGHGAGPCATAAAPSGSARSSFSATRRRRCRGCSTISCRPTSPTAGSCCWTPCSLQVGRLERRPPASPDGLSMVVLNGRVLVVARRIGHHGRRRPQGPRRA